MMALNLVPQDILPSRDDLHTLNALLASSTQTVAVVDLSAVHSAGLSLVSLAALLPNMASRARVILLRENTGLWPTDTKWVSSLGFAGLYAQADTTSWLAQPTDLMATVAKLMNIAPLAADALARYFSAMQITSSRSTPRGLIRHTTGLSAEALCAALRTNVKALDRTYHLKNYPSCFLGHEAVQWLAQQYTLLPDKAVQLGLALQKLGMLHHVAHEQPFADTANFYRTNASTGVDMLQLGIVLARLSSKTGLSVQDRSYHGKTYDNCFIGSEAVDWLKTHTKLSRHDSEILLNRLYSFHTIEHVTQDHDIRDGYFFYRFVH
jgi:Domain found in Dishevelled, Egl-10, and Pleckstrin (DEP)